MDWINIFLYEFYLSAQPKHLENTPQNNVPQYHTILAVLDHHLEITFTNAAVIITGASIMLT